MKATVIGATLVLTCMASSTLAYTIKTYQGNGASRIEACTLAKTTAESPDQETAHGHLIKVSACKCSSTESTHDSKQWLCLVQATHDR
ncbi:hypothetical protein P3T18_004346 [Paraburkholderia sp. GAS199]